MKVLYFDCFAGAAGDMILGALLDAGLPFDELKRALGSLGVDGVDVSVDRVVKTGITAAKFRVHEHAHAGAGNHHHPHHHLKHIFEAIDRSALSDSAKARAVTMFRRLGEAEGSRLFGANSSVEILTTFRTTYRKTFISAILPLHQIVFT